MALPFCPRPGNDTIINEPGHYKGYFAAHCHGKFKYTPPTDWQVIFCTGKGSGTHGFKQGYGVVLAEIRYIGEEIPDKIPPMELPINLQIPEILSNGENLECEPLDEVEETTKEISKEVIIGLVVAAIIFMVIKK